LGWATGRNKDLGFIAAAGSAPQCKVEYAYSGKIVNHFDLIQ
jgi:hypothetical protein